MDDQFFQNTASFILVVLTSLDGTNTFFSCLLHVEQVLQTPGLHKHSVLHTLDNQRLMRVDGRLKYSNFHFHKKHLILFPSDHSLAILISTYSYYMQIRNNLFSTLKQDFWPISGRNISDSYERSA